MIRTTGTHTGALKFGRAEYAATGREIRGAPECCSYTFNADGKVESFTGECSSFLDRSIEAESSETTNEPTNQPTNQPTTAHAGGYVVDRRVGNTGGLGALFGILTAIGVKVPKPGSLGFKIATAVQAVTGWFAKLFGGKE